jgi:WXG100 family type VII secretion target
MSQIRITPQELYDGASFTNDKASTIESELTALKSKIDEVTGNWEGAAQSSFIASFNELYSSFMQKFPPIIQGVAEQMKSAGQVLENADLEVSKAFQQN